MEEEQHSSWPVIMFASFVIVVGTGAFLYPDDWGLPLPLAAVFGPFLGFRMGLGESLPFLFVCMVLMAPVTIWKNAWTGVLLMIGLSLWLYSGYACGLWLYA